MTDCFRSKLWNYCCFVKEEVGGEGGEEAVWVKWFTDSQNALHTPISALHLSYFRRKLQCDQLGGNTHTWHQSSEKRKKTQKIKEVERKADSEGNNSAKRRVASSGSSLSCCLNKPSPRGRCSRRFSRWRSAGGSCGRSLTTHTASFTVPVCILSHTGCKRRPPSLIQSDKCFFKKDQSHI